LEKSPKNAEIIRPILRGRDIKRYGYQFAELYLITTFPSLKIDIEDYPDVKEHLLSFGMERLEQTGKTHQINGKTIKSRKRTNNKWFETSDSIAYHKEFEREKVVWASVVSLHQNGILDFPKFSYVPDMLLLDTTYFMVGEDIDYLIHVLNSKLSAYYLINNMNTLSESGLRVTKILIERFPIPPKPENIKIDEKNADKIVYQLYGFSEEEIFEIENSVT